MQHIVMYSGGLGSWGTAWRLVNRGQRPVLLFADTLIEDFDLYRFLDQGASCFGLAVEVVIEGRTPWQVFKDVKFLGNNRVDPCSRVLKREPLPLAALRERIAKQPQTIDMFDWGGCGCMEEPS